MPPPQHEARVQTAEGRRTLFEKGGEVATFLSNLPSKDCVCDAASGTVRWVCGG